MKNSSIALWGLLFLNAFYLPDVSLKNNLKNQPYDLNKAVANEKIRACIKDRSGSGVKTVPLASLYQANSAELRFVFFIKSFNNAAWYKKNLMSVFTQKYANYHILYVDDASVDGTADLVEKFAKEVGHQDKITIVRNDVNKGGCYNDYTYINTLPSTDICMVLDGDDWLPHEHILSMYNNIYQDKNVWLTYGNFKRYPAGKPSMCPDLMPFIKQQKNIRKMGYTPAPLRTFYVWLFKLVDVDAFRMNGVFHIVANDHAMMHPMLELAGLHSKYVPSISYIYNCTNAISVSKSEVKRTLNAVSTAHLRSQKLYDRISITSLTHKKRIGEYDDKKYTTNIGC